MGDHRFPQACGITWDIILSKRIHSPKRDAFNRLQSTKPTAFLVAGALIAACLVSTASSADDSRKGQLPSRSSRAGGLEGWRWLWGDDRLVDPLPERGQAARGLYFNGPVARRLGPKGVASAVRNARLDAAVIDLKDGEGRVLYDTKIDVLQKQKRVMLGTGKPFFDKLRAAGVYTIGRIVCFSDPRLPRNYPERAVMDARPRRKGQIWAAWGKRNTWLDPYNTANHDLIVQLAEEAEAMGLDEIQFDYFRFPVDDATRFALFPAEVKTPRRQVLLGLLRRVDQALRIPIGVDVFGLTAFNEGDRAGLGQALEEWAKHVDVITPMLYLNGMGMWLRGQKKNRALQLVSAGAGRLRRRLGYGPIIRPFLQAFPQGADYFNPAFIEEQIRGARQGGADGFLFWHPASNYATVRQAMTGVARHLSPFPLERRSAWRRQAWGDSMSPGARAAYIRDSVHSGSRSGI